MQEFFNHFYWNILKKYVKFVESNMNLTKLSMKNLILLLSAFIFIGTKGFSQNLNIEPNRGILIPKLSTVARSGLGSPSAGLMIYNTDTNKFNYYDGAAWQEAFFGNQWAVNGSNISYSGGNVGIGTLTPIRPLNIFNSSDANVNFNTTTSGTSITDGLYVGIQSTNKAFIYNFENAAIGIGTNNIERLTILGNGNVGIGNVAPTEKLTVNGNVVAPTLSLNTTNVAPNTNAILDMTSTTKGILIP